MKAFIIQWLAWTGFVAVVASAFSLAVVVELGILSPIALLLYVPLIGFLMAYADLQEARGR